MINFMSNWRRKAWRALVYTAVNAPLAVLAYWLPYKSGEPALGVLWATCVFVGDFGTVLMIPRSKE